jgi:hypothetical protein
MPENYTEIDIFRLIVKKSIEKKGGKMLTASLLLQWLETTETLYNKMQEAVSSSMAQIESEIEKLI